MAFNSLFPNFLQRSKVYCAKVLPLVFDNSLSYYEFLGHVCCKLNETIDAINAQNLNIVEFEKMASLEIEKFEAYVESRQTEFESKITTEFNEYKAELTQIWEEYKNELEKEWTDEQTKNEAFRTDITNLFNTFKADINEQIQEFETSVNNTVEDFKTVVNKTIQDFEDTTNADLTEFKNTVTNTQNQFEENITSLFNNFTTSETEARSDFESNFQKLFEQWKIDTLTALESGITTDITDLSEKLTTELTEEITKQITNIETELTNKINNNTRGITEEKEARESGDKNLQTQIDNLVLQAGGLTADTTDVNNAQLMVTNSEGTTSDIFPAVSNCVKIRETSDTISLNNYTVFEYDNNGVYQGNYSNLTSFTGSHYYVFNNSFTDAISAVISATFNVTSQNSINIYTTDSIPSTSTISINDLTFIDTITVASGESFENYDFDFADSASGYIVIMSYNNGTLSKFDVTNMSDVEYYNSSTGNSVKIVENVYHYETSVSHDVSTNPGTILSLPTYITAPSITDTLNDYFCKISFTGNSSIEEYLNFIVAGGSVNYTLANISGNIWVYVGIVNGIDIDIKLRVDVYKIN